MSAPRTLIIAEIGINHGGSLQKAKEMCSRALDSGADIAKFQRYRPALILGPRHKHFKEASDCQLTQADHEEVKQYCDEIGIEYCVSLFHSDHLPWAEGLGVRRYKIASRAISDLSLLNTINGTKKPVIISTGLAIRSVIRNALKYTDQCESQTLMHCIAEYPTPLDKSRPLGMRALDEFSVRLGISSHCPNIAPSIIAVTHGAQVVEQHVCISRDEKGVDISSSLTFDEFKQMSRIIRDMEACKWT